MLKSNVIRCVLALMLWSGLQAQTQVVRFRSAPNDGATGTTAGELAKINASGNAILAGTSDTAVPVYCVTAGAGTTGSASLASGEATCQADGSGITINHYLGASTATGGRLMDLGASIPSGVWIAGIAMATASANANVSFIVLGFMGSSGGGGGPLSNPSIGATAITETFTAGTGGVTVNTLVITDTSNPAKAIAATGGGAYGVAMSTVAASGSVEVARYGQVACKADNTATEGDLVIAGTSNVTYCRDSGQTASGSIAMGTRLIGFFRTSASAGSTAQVELTPAHFGTQVTQAQIASAYSGGAGCGTTTNSLLVNGNCGSGGGGGATAFQQLTDSQGTATSTVATMAAGGVWANGTYYPYTGTGTITVNSGSDSGVIGVGYNASGQRVCWTNSGTITWADYTVSSGSGGFGGSCGTSIPSGVGVTSLFTVTSGAFSTTVADKRAASYVVVVNCAANLIPAGFGCALDPTSALTWTGQFGISLAMNGAVGTTIASASTIAPTAPITVISGTTTIQTITAPAAFASAGQGGCLTFIASGAWSVGSSGNIASATFTATSGNSYPVCYNNATSTWAFVVPGSGGGGGTVTVDQVFQSPFILNPSGGEQITCDAGGTTPASTYGHGIWDLVQNDTNTCGFDVFLPSTYVASSLKLEILYDGPASGNGGSGTFVLDMNTALVGAGSDPTSLSYTSNSTSALASPGAGAQNALLSTGLLTLSLPSSPAGKPVRILISRVSGGTADTIGISRIHYQFQHN